MLLLHSCTSRAPGLLLSEALGIILSLVLPVEASDVRTAVPEAPSARPPPAAQADSPAAVSARWAQKVVDLASLGRVQVDPAARARVARVVSAVSWAAGDAERAGAVMTSARQYLSELVPDVAGTPGDDAMECDDAPPASKKGAEGGGASTRERVGDASASRMVGAAGSSARFEEIDFSLCVCGYLALACGDETAESGLGIVGAQAAEMACAAGGSR